MTPTTNDDEIAEPTSQFAEICESIRQLPRFSELNEPVTAIADLFGFKTLLILDTGRNPTAHRYRAGQSKNPTVKKLTASQYGQFLKARQRVGYLPLNQCKYCKNKQALRNLRQSQVFEDLDVTLSEFVLLRTMNQDGLDQQFLITELETSNLSDDYFARLGYIFCLLASRSAAETQISPSAILSRRQTECLWWISKGKTSDEISQLVGISKHTINNYIANASKKLGTANRTEAICLAIRQGLI